MQGSMNYREFDEARRKYFSGESSKLDLDESASFVRSFVPEANLKAWLGCKTICSQEKIGFHCWCSKYDSDTVTVEYKYNTPPNGKPVKFDSGQLINGRAYDSPEDKPFSRNYEFGVNYGKALSYKRIGGEAFTLTANFSGYPCKVFVPSVAACPLPPPPPPFTPILGLLLDAKDMNFVGFVPKTDRPVYLTFIGKWRAGPGDFPFLEAHQNGGRGTFRGFPMHSTVVTFIPTTPGREVQKFVFGGGSKPVPPDTVVLVQMNDDSYNDNESEPGIPMKAYLNH